MDSRVSLRHMVCPALCCRSYDKLFRSGFSMAPVVGPPTMTLEVLKWRNLLQTDTPHFCFFLRVFSRWEMKRKNIGGRTDC